MQGKVEKGILEENDRLGCRKGAWKYILAF
jgi:hypothetical protein